MIDRVIADAGTDRELCIRDRLTVLPQIDPEVRNISVSSENECLLDRNTVISVQRKFDGPLLALRQSDGVGRFRDLVIPLVDECVDVPVLCNESEGKLTRTLLESLFGDQLQRLDRR